MANLSPKLVETHHYHLWTDALHARKLAHQARNRWDRGTYVRWAVITAWTVMEMGCIDALNEPNIGYSFKKNLDAAISKNKLPTLNWGSGIWQEITKLQRKRKTYMHAVSSQNILFPQVSEANKAIEIVREGIKAIYTHTSQSFPTWINDDNDFGWDYGGEPGILYTGDPGVDANDPLAIIIKYLHKDKEYISLVKTPGTDPNPIIDDIIRRIRLPISAVRAYRGKELIEERSVKMRGG